MRLAWQNNSISIYRQSQTHQEMLCLKCFKDCSWTVHFTKIRQSYSRPKDLRGFRERFSNVYTTKILYKKTFVYNKNLRTCPAVTLYA